MKKFAIFVVFMLAFIGCEKADNSSIQTISYEQLEAIQAENKGKVLFLNVFASWCPPCEVETPDFVELYSNNSGEFELIGLSIDSSKKDLEEFINRHGIQYPVYHITPSIQRKLMADKVPTTLVFTPEGEYYNVIFGAIDKKSFLMIVNNLKN